MKRFWMIAVLVVVVAALAVTGVVLAQGPNPNGTPQPGDGFGPGSMMGRGRMMGRGGMMGGQVQGTGTGLMHDNMQAALAENLGITVDELTQYHADGLTFWQIAEQKGFTVEEAQQIMLDARAAALAQLVADGTITQEQADWMASRSGRMMGQGYGAGRGAGCPMWDGE